MKKKIPGMFVCILLITTAFPAVESLKNNTINATIPSTPLTSMTAWIEKQKLLASDGATEDEFGSSVSLSGDTALIGAFGDNDNGDSSGSAYVFTRSDTSWTQQAKLLASDAAAEDWFGYSISLSGDTALIGALGDDDNGNWSGSAYVFTRTGTSWTQQAKLIAMDGATNDRFGISVALNGDTAIIGALGDDDNGERSGSAYIFIRTGTTWTQQQKLLASDGAADAMFGCSVSLDIDTAIIGAFGADNSTGSAYVFTRTDISWTQQAKLLTSDGIEYGWFGFSVSLSSDTALISALDDFYFKGSAYVFTRSGTTWTQQAKLLASDGVEGDWFGFSVSLDGDIALIGAVYDDSGRGSAYIFTCKGTTWTQQAKLLTLDGAAYNHFGSSASLLGDTALIGAAFDDDNGNSSGSAYVFVKESGNHPPYPPTITGPFEGKVRVVTDYNFTAIDLDGDEVFYFIDWGDNTNSSWIGPYPSGEKITKSHTWPTKATYMLKTKAKDTHGNESDWATITVTMPCNTIINTPFLQFIEKLFQRFPHAFPLLRHLLGY